MTDRLSLDLYWLGVLAHVKARSTCPRRQVGAILTDGRGRILSTGYNGSPVGLPHCTDTPCAGRDDPHGDNSRCLAVHAEQNCLLQCRDLTDARVLYTSSTPCYACAKVLLNTPVTKIVAEEVYFGKENFDMMFVYDQVKKGRWEVVVRIPGTDELRPFENVDWR